jgi:hypothetical protein
MKIRTLLVFAAGIVAGLALAKKMDEDDPEVLHGPSKPASANPALRAASSQAQKVTDRAAVLSLEAIRRARDAIRERRGEEGLDEATWS